MLGFDGYPRHRRGLATGYPGLAFLGMRFQYRYGSALLGGVDVGTGVLAYLVVDHETGSTLLAGLAFSLGFVALLLESSELFTEIFLVPVTAVSAGR